jgi:hypothetical protein
VRSNYGGKPTFALPKIILTQILFMQKTIKLVAAIVLMSSVIAGCGGSTSSASPKEVFVAFTEKLSQKDYEGAAKLATTESQFILNMMKTKMESADKEADKKDVAEKFKNLEISDAKINGDVAFVPIKDKNGEFELEFPMKKENGGWKVDFTMNSMMNMASKAKSLGGGIDSTGTASPEDMQKASEHMRDAMKKVDSAMKAMTPEQRKAMQDMLKSATEKAK